MKTPEELVDLAMKLAEDDNMGICLACGDTTDGVEPDAERYKCQCCGSYAVYGAEQAILVGGRFT